jgi:hypothetical protein
MDQARSLRAVDGEPKVAREVAEADFERFCETMDLDVDVNRMNAEDLEKFNEVRETLLRSMERGDLIINEQGQPVYKPRGAGLNVQVITFYEPTGATFMAMDSKKKEQEVAKMHSIMADMTRLPEKTFAIMAQRDLKICKAICTLFLG